MQVREGHGLETQGRSTFFHKYCFPNLHWILGLLHLVILFSIPKTKQKFEDNKQSWSCSWEWKWTLEPAQNSVDIVIIVIFRSREIKIWLMLINCPAPAAFNKVCDGQKFGCDQIPTWLVANFSSGWFNLIQSKYVNLTLNSI